MTKRLLLAVALSVGSATLAFGQAPSSPIPAGFDSRWTPYLGCWKVAQEQVGQAAVPVAQGLMVCAEPSGRAGIQITTTVDGKNVLEQTVVGDGTAQPLTQGDCQGTQISEWSRDGERLFTKVELHCAGRPARTISGITEMAKGYWIDAQATIIDGDSDVRVRRYRRTSDPIVPAAAANAPMSIEDVIEASKKVIAPVLEAALVEAGGRFSLNSRVLSQLADAGVSPNVIDLMVAQAYPDRFEVDRPSMYPSAPSASTGYGTSTRSSTNVFMGMGTSVYPYPYYDPYFNSYYYYSPFAYPYYWGTGYFPYRYGYPYGYRNYYNNYYYGYPGSIYSSGGGGGFGSSGTAQPGSADSPGTGTVVATPRGYTRVRPSGSSGDSGGSSPRSGSGGGGRAVSGGDSGGGSVSSGGGNSNSNGGGGGSSSSSTSGGGGGGRTAQPR